MSRLSLTPWRIIPRVDVAEHHYNPCDAGHCDHKHEDHRKDQEKIAHGRISLLTPSPGEPILPPFELEWTQMQAAERYSNPAALLLHPKTEQTAMTSTTSTSATPAKTPRLTRARRTAILKALADPRRFELLERIAKANCPLGCSQAQAALKIAPATLSHHIKELETAGLIEIERMGKFHNLKLRPGVLDALAESLQSLDSASCVSR
jgi:ArsR family transcriptional regulator